MGVDVIEGLESGDFAVLTKLHHATIDGAAGALLTTMLLDDAPDTPLRVPGPLPEPGVVPSDPELFVRALGGLIRQPDRAVRIHLRMAQQLARAAPAEGASELLGAARRVFSGSRRQSLPNGDAAPAAPSTTAPRTSLNTMISAHRRVAFPAGQVGSKAAVRRLLAITVAGLRRTD